MLYCRGNMNRAQKIKTLKQDAFCCTNQGITETVRLAGTSGNRSVQHPFSEQSIKAGSSGPHPLAFVYLQGWRLHRLPSQPYVRVSLVPGDNALDDF